MDIHPRREQHVAALRAHLTALRLIYLPDKRLVKRAGKQRADRQQGAAALQPDARRAVGRGDGRNTLFA